jgi:predicted exporter
VSERRIRVTFAGAMLLMVAYAATHLELSTDVSNFMPEGSREEFTVLASRLADSELSRTMILTVGAPDVDTAASAASALAARLESHPEVAWLRRGLEPEPIEDFARLYFPRRHRFLSSRPEQEIPELVAPEALRARARTVRQQLSLPTATLFEGLVAEDPLGAFERVMGRLQGHRPALVTQDGQFVTADGRWAVIFLATRTSAFDSRPQTRLLSDIDAAFAEIDAGYEGSLTLEASGANRFAVAAERSIRGDVFLIGATSFVGVAVVFLVFLRSLHFFLLAIFPALAGILTAATLTRLVLGNLDGLTMAFGASLIGVTIDYSIHVLDHYRLEPETPPPLMVRRLRPSLVLGALTTMASFAGLGLTSFPGFREIGFFAVTGVATALGVTLIVLPGLLGGATSEPDGPTLARRTATVLGDSVRALSRHRLLLAAAPMLCAALMLAFLPRLRFVDDLSRLMVVDPALRAEESRVRERVARFDTGRVVVALGVDAEDAVARNDAVAARLEVAREAGTLEDFRSLHALLWSPELQDRNLRALATEPDLGGRVEAAFVAEGFRPGSLLPFREALEAPPAAPLDAAALDDSGLQPLLSSLLLDLGEVGVATVTYLRGVASPEALTEALSGLERTYVFDQRSFLNEIYREFRATTLRQMGVGCALVLLVLAARYRRVRPTLAAFLPSLLVAGTLLALLAALGVETNLLHVTSLIMVMGMGVDYGIFMVDSAGDPGHLDATMLSLLLSCLTTIFVFGTLALSQHAALRAIGTTAGVGVLLSFLLAPVTLVLLRRPGTTR